jgi:hypothetical protein
LEVLLLTVIASLAGTGCGDELTASGAGELDVVISTSGSAIDADGYRLVVRRAEGAIPLTDQAVGVEATVVLPNVEPGVVVVELRELAEGCVVQGEHPRPVEVRAQVGTQLDLVVVCGGGA